MTDTGFDNIRLPDEIEMGSTGGPQFYTSVLTLGSGAEARNQNWQDAKCAYDISYGVNQDTFYTVIKFFRARRGRLRAFRFKDWTDFQAVGEVPAGAVDGVNKIFQLQKTYDDGLIAFTRKITRPVRYPVQTIVVYLNGVPTTAFTMEDTGILHLTTAPAVGVVVTCDFEFDVPVRFDSDVLALNMQNFNAHAVGSINLTEIIE